MSAYAGVDVSDVLRAGMKTAAMNHRLIANNIANADTPNYTPTEMDFQETLVAMLEGRDRIALRRTDPRHLEAERSLAPMRRQSRMSKNDYNKVDMEHEVAKLAENTSRYNLYGSLLAKRYRVHRDLLSNIR